MSSRETGDLIMMGIGGFTPLDGFMTHADWQGVCDGYKMANGLFWPIPVTLSTDEVTAQGINVGADIALVDGATGDIMGTMKVTEKYGIDKAVHRHLQGRVRRPVHDPRRDPRQVRATRLVQDCRVPDPQPDAPQP
jgi:sulfate adenylyltransferase